ncbi:MAG: GNAT family N-acetyltransferase [Comamonas sp.]
MAKPERLTTPRLVLRQWEPQDFPAFAQLNADPEVMRYFPATLDRQASDALAARCQALIAERGWGFWAAQDIASGRMAGMIGLHIPTADLPFSPCVEIGWRLARPFWGRGLATEGAKAALDFAWNVLQLDEVVSFTAVQNLRSQAVMQRLGMQADAQTFMHPALPANHALAEHCLYRIRRR